MPEGLTFSKSLEHLDSKIPGAEPIMTCFLESNFDFQEYRDNLQRRFDDRLPGVHNIDFSASSHSLNLQGFLNAGYETYVISIVDGYNKFSEDLFDCTGLVVVGIDKGTGKNISFVSHADPKKFFFSKKQDFISHLQQRLAEIKERSQEGTIDAIVVGGNYLNRMSHARRSHKEIYLNSIQLISEQVQGSLGFKPAVINGPKLGSQGDTIYFDNENRKLYLVRPRVNPYTNSFVEPTIDQEKEKWDEHLR